MFFYECTTLPQPLPEREGSKRKGEEKGRRKFTWMKRMGI